MEAVHIVIVNPSAWRKLMKNRPREHGELPYLSETLYTNLDSTKGGITVPNEPNGD